MALFNGDPGNYKEPVKFEWKDGDRVVCVAEDSEIKPGKEFPYASTVFRVLAGPTNDPTRYAGPVRGMREGRPVIFSKMLYGMHSFSPKSFCQEKILGYLSALGHTRKVDLEDDPDWQDNTLDREVVVFVEMEEYQGKLQAKANRFDRLGIEDRRLVSGVYAEFGCARGFGWAHDPKDRMEPIHPWEYSDSDGSGKEDDQQEEARGGFSGGRRGRVRDIREPTRDDDRGGNDGTGACEGELEVAQAAASLLQGSVADVSGKLDGMVPAEVLSCALEMERGSKRPRKGAVSALEDALANLPPVCLPGKNLVEDDIPY